jgi:protoporphyrinogen oxidase
MLGMTLAHRLAAQGKQVTLIEAAPEFGGLAAPWRLGDVVWDRHYHVILMSDGHLRRLLDELGLDQDIRWVRTRTGVFANHRLHSVSNSIELLRFPALGLVDKARLAATILLASRITDWQSMERQTVSEWLIRWSGRNTYERFWLPLLRSKLGDAWRDTSAAFIWATIQRLYAARRSGLKEERFGYVPGGYRVILDRLETVLRAAGVDMRVGRPVQKVGNSDGRPFVRLAGGETLDFDRVVLTTAAPLAARMCPDLRADESDRLLGVRYLGIVCPSVLLREPLSDFYVTNLLDPGLPFTGVIEMDAMVDRHRELGGNALVYLPRYVAPGDPFITRPDDEIRDDFLTALERMFPRFRRRDVVAFQVSRVSQVMTLPTLGYSQRLPPIRTSIPGVYILNSAHIVNGTLNVNETVQLAERGAAAFARGDVGDRLPDPNQPEATP